MCSKYLARKCFVILTLFCSICFFIFSNISISQGAAVDTTSWKTHCVGRYLIDLPPNARTKYRAGIEQNNLFLQANLNKTKAMSEAQKRIAAYKATKHEKLPGSQFIASHQLEGGGIAIVYYTEPHITATAIISCYFIAQNDHNTVFRYDIEVGDDNLEKWRDFVTALAKTIYSRAPDAPVPNEPGLAIPGGLANKNGELAWSEQATLNIRIPNYPGIALYFETICWSNDEEFMFDDPEAKGKIKAIKKRFDVLIQGDCDLQGIKAQELGAAETKEGRREYNFFMNAPAKGKNVAYPALELRIFSLSRYDTDEDFGKDISPTEYKITPPSTYEAGNGFNSDEEAIAVWEAIRNSIRLRPGAI